MAKDGKGDSSGPNEKPRKGGDEKPQGDKEVRQPARGKGKGSRRDGGGRKGGAGGKPHDGQRKPGRNDRGRGKPRGGRQQGGRPPHQRRHGVRKTIKNGVGTVFIGQEDPFIYFPDIIALFAREDIKRVELRALGPAISNAVNVSEQVRHRFLEEADVKVANVEIGTDNAPRSSGKGTYRVSFIHISLERGAAAAADADVGDEPVAAADAGADAAKN
uniref:Archaeal DNA-binding protein n=1 Tax=uncultured marine group II/III euryarchaeote KM3_141_A08 TaxID=1457875 RepID=A0A075GHH1_9EURY|nr:Archaeal DNA-binding protein [uncultured marine group II/III euryarchaeote KM3_141_A08]